MLWAFVEDQNDKINLSRQLSNLGAAGTTSVDLFQHPSVVRMTAA